MAWCIKRCQELGRWVLPHPSSGCISPVALPSMKSPVALRLAVAALWVESVWCISAWADLMRQQCSDDPRPVFRSQRQHRHHHHRNNPPHIIRRRPDGLPNRHRHSRALHHLRGPRMPGPGDSNAVLRMPNPGPDRPAQLSLRLGLRGALVFNQLRHCHGLGLPW